MDSRLIAVIASLAFPLAALGQTGYSITGGLSNFDCGNHCDDPCDEFEIEIEDCRPEDVVHTYANSNYHSPTVTLSLGGTSTIIDYRNPTHLTAVGAIEHFGVSLRQLSATKPIHVRWMRNGQPATVNGQIPIAGGGTAPATQPMLPSINTDTGVDEDGLPAMVLEVTNNDPVQYIWVKRRAQITTGVVTLEALMPNDPVVTSTLAIDSAPILIAPGQTLTATSDLIEIEAEDHQTAVFAAEYYQDLFSGGPFGSQHILGPQLGNVMTATIASPDQGCANSGPQIVLQPHSTNAAVSHEVQLQVDAEGNDMPMTYQWMKEGVPLANDTIFHGVTTDELTIVALSPATEGFYSIKVMNACGFTVSDSALIFITGHNVPPQRTYTCPAVASQPASLQTCPSGVVSLTGAFSGTTPLTYKWKVLAADGVTYTDLTDGTYADPVTGSAFDLLGADTASLMIGNYALAAPANTLNFVLTATNPCGTASTTPVIVTIGCSSRADVASLGGAPGCDGQLTVDDLVYYLAEFFAGDTAVADLASLGGDPTPDGQITVDDLVNFLGSFFAGCQ